MSSVYHKRKITKGTVGKSSKVQEELDELIDAEEQDNIILVHVELSDLYGAVEALAQTYGLEMVDLKMMSDLTREAFKTGQRK